MKAVVKLTGPMKVKFRIFGITLGYMNRTVNETWNIPFDFGSWDFPINIKGIPASILFHSDGKTEIDVKVVVYGMSIYEQAFTGADVVNFLTKGKPLSLPLRYNNRGVIADLLLKAEVV